LTEEETEIECAAIRFAQADFVWVGLGTPKQEIWMHENRGRCGGAILLGVGAAFDVHAGAIERAPCWMQRSGLEWLFRLSHDPRRLWKRYVILAPIFAVLALFELVTGRINALPASRRPAA
jgi:N-acetylglucosaminyldiphosphoundecaprenol N-acetyl-beta-D-mannosaminyltransferase